MPSVSIRYPLNAHTPLQAPSRSGNTMNSIRAILKKNPTILSLFIITPDETVAHCHTNTLPPLPCPANHLNRFYHDATQLVSGSHEVILSFETTWITLRPLPQNWIMAIHHHLNCPMAAIDALQEAAHPLPKNDTTRREGGLSILTSDTLMKGELGTWILPLMRLRAEITGDSCTHLVHQAMNRWINTEDPCQEGLCHLATLLATTMDDPAKQAIYTEKAQEILASVTPEKKGKKRA